MRRLLAVLLAALGFSAAAGASPYLIEAELWIDGEPQGSPTVIVKIDEPASIEVEDGQTGWRLEFELEQASDVFAPAGALWVHVAVHSMTDGEWEHLADSILGVPEGETATLSVVDGDAPATPETAILYLKINTSRLRQAPDG